jgi:molybdopterin molybdotransferase
MIEYENAIKLILNHIMTLNEKIINISKSNNFTLSQNIFAPIDLPPFNNSAVDGYAFNYNILSKNNRKFKIIDTISAGKAKNNQSNKNSLYRIMTGAKIPDQLNTVIMQEDTNIIDNSIVITKDPLINSNIRYKGEDVIKGKLIIKKHTKINPIHIGLLATMGINQIKVFEDPEISIISTGDELIKPGQKISDGQVYSSNDLMIKALLNKDNIFNVSSYHINDNLKNLTEKIKKNLCKNIIIITGGMSVGKYDFTKKALKTLDVKKIFFKGNWKPGKPLFFGKKNNCYIFGLPGNLVASYMMYKIFISSFINKSNIWKSAKIKHDFKKKINTNFVSGLIENDQIRISKNQNSHCIGNLSKANCICLLSSKKETILKNELIFYKYI